MSSAIFCVPIENNNPVLPPMSDPGDGSIYLAHGEGHGYSCVGLVPNTTTCLVRVYTDQAVIEAMALDNTYIFIEQVEAA